MLCFVTTALIAQGHVNQDALNAHNSVRARHRAAPLSWDNNLEGAAAAYAARCEFKHDPNKQGQGEILYVSSNTNNPVCCIQLLVRVFSVQHLGTLCDE